VLAHLERLKTLREFGLPNGLEQAVHQNRLLKLAREGGPMTAQHLRDLEPARRYATLVAVILDTRATLIDEIIDLHDRFMGALFSKAKRHHADRFQASGQAINDKVRLYSRIGRALLDAKQSGNDPFAAIEAIIPWDVFSASITEAEKLAQPEAFDYLALVGDGFNQLRRYTPTLLATLTLRAAPAARELLAGVEVLKGMNERQARKVPDDAPTSFVRKRWASLVRTPDGLDRRYYELCVLSELKNSLRSGDIWVQDSRQFKDFEDYLCRPRGSRPSATSRRWISPSRPTASATSSRDWLCWKTNWRRWNDSPPLMRCPTRPSPARATSRSRRWTTPCHTTPKH
jgi:hypothetical protein